MASVTEVKENSVPDVALGHNSPCLKAVTFFYRPDQPYSALLDWGNGRAFLSDVLKIHMVNAMQIFWLLTKNDVWTFVIPNTIFGIFGALAGPVLTTSRTVSLISILARFPSVLVWNWLNLTIFDLANQRQPDSVAEDTLNKPWRVIPAGRVTPTQMRRMLLASLPIVLAINYTLGAWQETALIFTLTWMYNDLRGGDEDFVLRDLIIAVAFAVYNEGSLRIACGTDHCVTPAGFRWIALISAVVFTTMHIQDLKDVDGDLARERRTLPIVFGSDTARRTVATSVLFWAVFCPLYLRLGVVGHALPVTLGGLVALKTLREKGPESDHRSWQLWAGWLMCLYALPLFRA